MVTQLMTPQQVRDLQSVTPAWMDKVLTQAENEGKNVDVTRRFTPFGNFTISVEISEKGVVV